jgi:Cu2+-exporting ATPase
MGWMPAWLAGLGMALSSLLVVLNAARLTRRYRCASDAVAESAQRAVTAPAAPPLLGVR